MRPRGEIRAALALAVDALPSTAPSATWRDLAQLACVGFDAARRTVDNMVTAGELIVVGHRRTPHACRPMRLLARPGACAAAREPSAFEELARCWAEFK